MPHTSVRPSPRPGRVLFLTLLFLTSFALPAIAQQPGRPIISKIDPPNWWIQMPDPMLLIHGENLAGATFTVRGVSIPLHLLKTSPNGHWAFLTLHASAPRTLLIEARNPAGSASAPFAVTARRPPSEQPRGFSPADVMYLIMPDRFADGDLENDHIANFKDPNDRTLARAYHGGDLRGIEHHLDYLQSTGVTTVWTTPLYDNTANQSRDSYHGYSASDMYAVDPHLGAMADYQSLVRAAHARGMKIVLDTVPNHVGPHHPWISDSPTPDWFHGTQPSHINVNGDFASVTDPHATNARRTVFLNGWFADLLPDMNQENPLVSRYLIQNAVWWVESAGLDGLRIDTFPYVPRSFWHDFHQQLHTLYPKLTTVGEVFNQDPTITSFFAGGVARTGSDGLLDTGLDTPFDFPMYFALRDTLIRHAPMSRLADVLRYDALYPHPQRLVTFIGNHDTTRFLSEPGATPQALQLAFGLLGTLRGMPQLYSGDEIAMLGGEDPDNRRDFPGGFPGDTATAFTSEGRTPSQAAAWNTAAAVLKLRRESPALQTGEQQDVFVDDTGFAFVRGTGLSAGCRQPASPSSGPGPGLKPGPGPGPDRFLVLVNNSASPRELSVPTDGTALESCASFTPALSESATPQIAAHRLTVTVPAFHLALYKVN